VQILPGVTEIHVPLTVSAIDWSGDHHYPQLPRPRFLRLPAICYAPAIQWHEWGEEAFATARRENKPVLLDIGAVWCHWCHVMDRESYDDPEVAAIVNEHFIAVKVDRDERPDIDSRYQAAVQAVSGQGGWPLTAFLTPDGKPFYGGTYFPPIDGYGVPAFGACCSALPMLTQRSTVMWWSRRRWWRARLRSRSPLRGAVDEFQPAC